MKKQIISNFFENFSTFAGAGTALYFGWMGGKIMKKIIYDTYLKIRKGFR